MLLNDEQFSKFDKNYHDILPKLPTTPIEYLLGDWNINSVRTLHEGLKISISGGLTTIDQVQLVESELFQDSFSRKIFNDCGTKEAGMPFFQSCIVDAFPKNPDSFINSWNKRSSPIKLTVVNSIELTGFDAHWLTCTSPSGDDLAIYWLMLRPSKESFRERLNRRFSVKSYLNRLVKKEKADINQ